MLVKLFWKNNPTGFPRRGLRLKDVPVLIKLIKKSFSPPTGENARELEAEINAWLSERPGIRVVDIKQSASGGSFGPSLWLVSIWYENPATD